MTAKLKLARVVPAHHPKLEPVPWPAYKTEGAAGMDLAADVDEHGVYIPAHGMKIIPTGLKMEIPVGYEGQVRPRGGIAFKNLVTVINSPGTIDWDYRGEVLVGLVNHSDAGFHVNRGDRIAQLVLCPIFVPPEVQYVTEDDLGDTVRGSGAFGSTGINDVSKR